MALNSVLKRYYPEGQSIRLESSDRSFLTVRSEHISIQGVLVGLFEKLLRLLRT